MSSSQQWQTATVKALTEVADRIQRITLGFEQPVHVRPGAHLKVQLELDGTPAVRSYSIVDASDDGLEASLSVFHTPHSRGGSTYMHSLQVGDSVRVTEPLQDFPLRIGAPKYVLVAGGIGITAIRGMATLLRRLGADYSIHYSARSPQDMAYRMEMIEEHGAQLTTYFDSEGQRLDIPALINSIEPGTELYMCGPIRLMDAIRRAWNTAELDPTNLRFETFGNSGWFQPEKFKVAIPSLGVSTEIGQNESILEALEKAGVPIMSDCRRGECGLCQVKILDRSGEVDHRDVFFSDRQKSTSEKLCACVSRVAMPKEADSLAQLTIDVP